MIIFFSNFGPGWWNMGNNINNRDDGGSPTQRILRNIFPVLMLFGVSGPGLVVPLLLFVLSQFVMSGQLSQFNIRGWFSDQNRTMLFMGIVLLSLMVFDGFLLGNFSPGDSAPPRRTASRGHAQQQQQPRDPHREGQTVNWYPLIAQLVGMVWMLLLSASLYNFPAIHRYLSTALPANLRRYWVLFARSSGLLPTTPVRGNVPASKSAVEQLEDVTLTERDFLMAGGPVLSCPICLENYYLNESGIVRFPCKHLYHRGCVLPWLEKHNSCPTCRHELPTDDPVYEDERRFRSEETQQRAEPPLNAPRGQSEDPPAPHRAHQHHQQPERGPRGFEEPTPRPPTRRRSVSSGSIRRTGGRAWRAFQDTLGRARAAVGRNRGASFSNLVEMSQNDEGACRRWLGSQSVRGLREIAESRGVDIVHCVEKREVVDRIVESLNG